MRGEKVRLRREGEEVKIVKTITTTDQLNNN